MELFWLVLAYIFGLVTMAIPTILTDEWKRWRDKREEKSKAREKFFQEIKGWLTRYRTRWKGFLAIKSRDYKSFKNELKWHADQMTNTLSSDLEFLNDKIRQDLEQIANEMWRFGEFQLYMGCENEFIEWGNEIDRMVNAVIEQLQV